MFAHDSQVFCGQTSGRELGSGISWFSLPWTTPDIRQEVCEDKAGGGLDQGKHKKESKLLAESLKTNRIKRGGGGGEAPRKIIQERVPHVLCLYRSGNFYAGCKPLRG